MYVDNDSSQSTAKETVTGSQTEDVGKREGQPRQVSRGRSRRGGGGRGGKHQAPPPPPQPPQPPEPTVNMSSDEVKEATLALKGMLGIGGGGGGGLDEDDHDEGFVVPSPALPSALAATLATGLEDDAEELPPTAPSKKKKNNRKKKQQQQQQRHERDSATDQNASTSAVEERESTTPPPSKASKNSKQKQANKNKKKDKAGRGGGGRGGDASSSSRGGTIAGRGSGAGEEKYAWSAFQSAPDAALLPMPAFGSSSSSLLAIGSSGGLENDSDFLAATEPRLLPDKVEEDTVHDPPKEEQEEATELEPHAESADSADEGEHLVEPSSHQADMSGSTDALEDNVSVDNCDGNDGSENTVSSSVDIDGQKMTGTSSSTEEIATTTATPVASDEPLSSVPATTDSDENKTQDIYKEGAVEADGSAGDNDGEINASGGINLAALASNSPPNKSNAQQPVPPPHQQPPQQQQMQSITAMMGGTYMAAQQQQQQQQQQQGPYVNHAYAHQTFQHLHGVQPSNMMGMMGGPVPHPHGPLLPHHPSLATPQPQLQPHQQHRYGAAGGGGTPPAPPPSGTGAGFLTIHVQVPPGLPRVGGQMMVQTPSGYPVPVMVPDGVAPGMVIPVNIPAPGAGNRPPPPVYPLGGGRGPHPPHHPAYQPMQFPPQMSGTRGMGPHGMMGGGAPAGAFHPSFGPRMGPMPPPPPPPPTAQQDAAAGNADSGNKNSTR